ncbi:unnamed protein product [Scytosiphon promiscuus]
MEQVAKYSPVTQDMMLATCIREIDEAVRLCRLDPANLREEQEQMMFLQAGLNKSQTTNQAVMGVLWLRDRLLESCQDGSSIDYKKMDEQFSTLKKVVGLPKHAPQRGAGLQPIALAQSFQGAWTAPPQGLPPLPGFDSHAFVAPPQSFGQPPFGGQGYGGPQGGFPRGGKGGGQFGAPGHYGSRNGGGRGGGRGQGNGRQLPYCRKCQERGFTDIRHSHTVCPLTICFNCKKAGHTRNACTNPPAP